MVMLDNRRNQWSRTRFGIWVERMRALHDTPAMIAAAVDQFDHLPEILTDVPDPDLAGVRIEAEAPRIPEPISPDFRARAGGIDEGVVFRNAVIAAGVGMIDVELHHDR